MRRKPFVLAIAILGTLGTSSALAQTASVLAVVPEGAVIDVAQLPDLQANAKVGFHRPDVSGPEVAQGSIVDVRDGRALVKLNAGGDVQAGDVAVPCASLLVSGSQTDLRATIQGLKAQMAPTGGGSADLQTVLAQLESVLDFLSQVMARVHIGKNRRLPRVEHGFANTFQGDVGNIGVTAEADG